MTTEQFRNITPEELAVNSALYAAAKKIIEGRKIQESPKPITPSISIHALLNQIGFKTQSQEKGTSNQRGLIVVHASCHAIHLRLDDAMYSPGYPTEQIEGKEKNVFEFFFDSTPILHLFLIMFPQTHALYPDGITAVIKNVSVNGRGHGGILFEDGSTPTRHPLDHYLSPEQRVAYETDLMKETRSIFRFISSVLEQNRMAYVFKRNLPMR